LGRPLFKNPDVRPGGLLDLPTEVADGIPGILSLLVLGVGKPPYRIGRLSSRHDIPAGLLERESVNVDVFRFISPMIGVSVVPGPLFLSEEQSPNEGVLLGLTEADLEPAGDRGPSES